MNDISFPKNKLLSKNNFLNWIIGGIVALIITKVSDPISEFVFTNILNIGGNFITHISNTTYKEISNGFSDQSSSIILYFIFLIVIYFLLFIFLYFYKKNRNLNYKIKELFESTDNPTDEFYEEDIDALKKNIKKLSKKISFLFLLSAFSILILIFIVIFIYGQTIFIRNKIIVITNNIEIVSPYVSDIEYKQFKSKFHSIENQSDYDAIMEDLKIIANENSLKLK